MLLKEPQLFMTEEPRKPCIPIDPEKQFKICRIFAKVAQQLKKALHLNWEEKLMSDRPKAKPLTVLLMSAMILGLIGTVLFFPVNLGNRYTCLFHRLTSGAHPSAHELTTHRSEESPAGGESSAPGSSAPVADEHHAHGILQHYVFTYGLLWWFSLLLTAAALFELRKRATPSRDRLRNTN